MTDQNGKLEPGDPGYDKQEEDRKESEREAARRLHMEQRGEVKR